ncbi:TPA: tyrosine-type recombinase/integrase [Klebsiella oxytoca]
MKLTVKKIESAKPAEKPFKIFDGGGLYVLINPNGSKLWRLKYRLAGKEKTFSIGKFPDVSLSDARAKAAEARKKISDGQDPVASRRIEEVGDDGNTFQAVALEWYQRKQRGWSEPYAKAVLSKMEAELFPVIGHLPVGDVRPVALLKVMHKVEDYAPSTAAKMRRWCNDIFNWAIVTERAQANPASALGVAMSGYKSTHYPFLIEPEIPAFFRKLEDFRYTSAATYRALRLLMYVGLRPVEQSGAEWSEIDLDAALWEIPKERMKKSRPHLIPLARQVVELLKEIREESGGHRYVFPNYRDRTRPMTSTAVLQLIYRMGYTTKASAHGWRHTFSTILNEKGFNRDWIEMQIAHVDRNNTRGTYNHALYIDGRREMMQWYADHLDRLRDSIQD